MVVLIKSYCSFKTGIGHFFQDLRRMCCWCPPTLCKSHLIVFISSVCPFLICSLLYIHSADLLYPLRSSMYPPYMYPLWSMYLGYTIICLPLLCFPLAAVHYLLLQPIPSAQYHIPNRSLAIPLTQNQKRSGPLMTFLDKLQHSFRPTFTYRANELRYTGYGQRCNKSFGTSAGLLHAGLVSHCSNENQRLQSNHRSLPITSTLCCPLGAGNINSVNSALTTNGPVCFSSSLPATNPYSSSICPCSASTVAAISDPKCRIRCECVRLLPGECNQTFVQEF